MLLKLSLLSPCKSKLLDVQFYHVILKLWFIATEEPDGFFFKWKSILNKPVFKNFWFVSNDLEADYFPLL